MVELSGFKDVVPHLTHPLALVGFNLLMVFGAQRALLKAVCSPPLTPQARGAVVQNLSRYGFVIGLLVIFLGFGLALYTVERERNAAQSTSILKQNATAKEGGTAINTGGDFTIGAQQSPRSAETTASPGAQKEFTATSLSQDAKAEGGGVAINAGREAHVQK